MKITLCQCNPLVGDVYGNAGRVCDIVAAAAGEGSDLVVFPELFLQGYPPRDLLEQPWFMEKSADALTRIAACSRRFTDTGILLGAALPNKLPHREAAVQRRGFVCGRPDGFLSGEVASSHL